MTDDQLRDEAMTLFMAGHETTANTLAWVWFLLANHPESEAKLHTEADSVLGDRPPTIADLPQLKYTGLVVTEALARRLSHGLDGGSGEHRTGRAGWLHDSGGNHDLHAPVDDPPRPTLVQRAGIVPPRARALGLQEQIHRYALLSLRWRSKDLHW